MQEHPIPQDITGYKFHIIGSMTLKQFGEIFLGVIVAVILWKTNIIAIIKWPMILFSIGLGAASAFVPIEERPLDHWIITFFKVLYKPTKFYWKKTPKIPDVFEYQPDPNQQKPLSSVDLTKVKKQRIKEYVGAIQETSSFEEDFSQEETLKIKSILDSFQTIPVSQTTVQQQTKPQEKPRMEVRVRKMRQPVVQQTIIYDEAQTSNPPTAVIYEDKKPPIVKQQQKKVVLKSSQVANDIQIPQEQIIKNVLEKDKRNSEFSDQVSINDHSVRSFIEASQPHLNQAISSEEAQYNSDLPFPVKPSEPNKVVGMVLSKNSDLITNAIVEIRTLEGSIVRAVKTNALGQFFITTPLKAGEYLVVIEKEGYQFQPQHLVIKDEIVAPMEIRSDN